MRILGIETSCDETAAAVVEKGSKIISNVVASSVELHQQTGGIIPEVAAREQLRWIMPVTAEAIRKTPVIDALAVTVGPGLIGSLLVGVETAKTLSYLWQKPLIAVNHLQAHLYANWLFGKKPRFPAIGLVVSGGHTDLVLMANHGQLKWLGGTRDDAAGECFDKTARLLGLGYPGGPEISRLAEKGNCQAYNLPRPMLNQPDFDFSFSGLKTAVLNLVKKEKKISQADLAASVQTAIVDCLVEKTLRAAKKYQPRSVLLSGGVAANNFLRERLKFQTSSLGVKFFVPPKDLCTDNAAIVAAIAYFQPHFVAWQEIRADPSLTITEMI